MKVLTGKYGHIHLVEKALMTFLKNSWRPCQSEANDTQ